MSIKPVCINVNEKHNKGMNVENKRLTVKSCNRFVKDNRKLYMSRNNNSKSLWNRLKIKFVRIILIFWKRKSRQESQVDLFQNSIKLCLLSGQFIGIFPFTNMKDINVNEKRYNFVSWRYLLCFMTCFGQMAALVLNFYGLTKATVTMTRFSFFLFYLSNCLTSVIFMRIGTKWHYLIKQIVASELNEYLDTSVKFKCNIATLIVLFFAIVEHMLSRISKLAEVKDCSVDDDMIYQKFVIATCPWVFELGVRYTFAIGLYLMVLNTIATIIWSYSHLFIICISLYLTSILEQLNNKITSRDGQHLPASYWRKLREDYNRATRLVRCFDDVINSIVFTSFASNLFFVCLQLYYLLARSIKVIHSVPEVACPNYPSGLFNGYEHTIYFAFSLTFVLARALAVSLIAARVHSASLVAAPSLYNVPSSSYGTEIQRFLDQVHGDTVGLTGLKFFYVTKELVLSVVGTVVTYELVLLQFNQ